jgi:tape measure domain-containing protein
MMKQLNDFTAKTPFQIDAVANSARQLIASGTGIGEVNDQLQFLGDIAATSGSSINEIAAIFAKVNAKGKVELESLNQLAERGIPIFKALSDATGLPASKLGAGRVSVEQFNSVLKSFAQEGGFAAGAMERLSETAAGKFSTAMDNLKLAGAELVESLMPALKEGIDFVTKLAQKFSNFNDKTQKTILIVGTLVAALGPLLTILPQLVSSARFLGAAFAGLSTPVLAVGAAIAAAVVSFIEIKKVWENSKSSGQKLRDSIQGVERAVISQTKEARALVAMYGEEKTSLEDRERILNRLKEIDATHFGNLQAENTSYENLNKSLTDYVANIKSLAIEKALGAEGQELYNAAAQAEIGLFDAKQALAQKEQDLIDKGIERDGLRFKAAMQLNAHLTGAVTAYTSAVEQSTADIEEFENRKAEITKRFAAIHSESTDEVIDDNTRAAESYGEYVEQSNLVISEMTLKLNELAHMGTMAFETLSNGVQEFTVSSSEQLLAFLNDFEVVSQQIDQTANKTAEAFNGLGNALGNTFGDLITGAIDGKEALKQFASQVIAALVSTAIANAIANGSSASNPANQVSAGLTIPSFITSAMSVVAGAITQIPAFAEGGMVYGPGLAMVGDNKNAAVDPEVIAPLSKLKSIMGGNGTNVYGRISGDDIVISNDRATRDRNRFE